MATLPNLLALYGALDPAESTSNEPEAAEVAARYLPATEGRGGWYRSIVDFFAPRNEAVFPDVDRALESIADSTDEGADALTIPQTARLVYVLGALSHHPDYAPRVEEREGLFARVLALAGPEGRETPVEVGYGLQQHLFDEFDGFADWAHVTRTAVRMGLLEAKIAAVSPCRASVQTVRGYRCAVIDTVSVRPDITLTNLKNVIDPLNWPMNSPELFCGMDKQKPFEVNGWRRVLESVSLGCSLGLERLVTPLKYYNSDVSATKSFVVYELDKGPKDGDGRVKVDQGFIKMEALKPGVRVRTKKIVHITPLSPEAQVVLVCASGYAAMADEMMFGNADDTPADAVKWKPSKPGSGQTESPATDSPTPPQPGLVSITVDMWEKCAKDMTAKNTELSSKWLANKLTVEDLIGYTQYVGADLASAPWRYLKALSQVPVPGTPPEPPGDGSSAS
ncbi:hypothetical protein H7J88_20300 [Mycolicibacterium flavescens]|uniref:Uncharacterized protein n=1 Tax=Mycolicibacterium flavescens TaxID=1776 RepID=A0A1E3RLB3_MYCFV|nr:hypothetical protein [Mycolicibacterium flavescens]MCV7281974.1 hypothetical protein [Mycolicibacterium flavescens]ODQ90661.1 hypothetical protein BHQ18_07915 [Mycolicibacterium flavescens]